jgi:hypothetical protein
MDGVRKFKHWLKANYFDRKTRSDLHLEEEYQHLAQILLNRVTWNASRSGTAKKVVVLGSLFEYGPNYLLRSIELALRVAKGDQDLITIFLPVGRSSYPRTIALLTKISIKNVINLKTSNFLTLFIVYSKSKFYAKNLSRKVKSIGSLIDLRFRDVSIGDLIYDDYLKLHNTTTFQLSDINLQVEIEKALRYYFLYNALLARQKAKILITTHLCYLEYGMVARVANSQGMDVIETTDIITSVFSSSLDNRSLNYHTGIQIQLDLRRDLIIEQRDKFLTLAKRKLQARFLGKIKQIDAIRAYTRTGENLECVTSIIENYPNKILVVLFAHVFNDSPHTSSGMVYQDYFVWLEETILICADNKKIHLIIKPHPGSSSQDLHAISDVFQKHNLSNFSILPLGVNTYEILKISQAVLTVQGTIGLEAAALGKLVLTAGNAFYSGRGFTVDSTDQFQYANNLKNLHKLKPPSIAQMEEALFTFNLWDDLFDWENPLVPTECIQSVWAGHPVIACKELLENLTMDLINKSTLFNNRQLEILLQ